MKTTKSQNVSIKQKDGSYEELNFEFISEKMNDFYGLADGIESRIQEIRKNPARYDGKIQDYDQYERDFYRKQGATADDKLPHLILVFNSPKHVLQMPGFPCLMKEKAEILEGGSILAGQFGPIEYIEAIEQYAAI